MSVLSVDYFILIKEVKRFGGNLYHSLCKQDVLEIAHTLELEQLEYELVDVEKMLYRTFRSEKEDD